MELRVNNSEHKIYGIIGRTLEGMTYIVEPCMARTRAECRWRVHQCDQMKFFPSTEQVLTPEEFIDWSEQNRIDYQDMDHAVAYYYKDMIDRG